MTTQLSFRILGPVQVFRDGEPVAIGGRQRRALLALLVINRNRTVAVREIIDALWEESPPADPGGSIQVAVAGLRRGLHQSNHVGAADVVTTESGGYRLTVQAGAVDEARFSDLFQQGVAAQRAGDFLVASTRLRAALAEPSGDALQDLRGLRFADTAGARLDERVLTCTETCAEIELDLGRHNQLADELAELTAKHPLRERLLSLYLLALYRGGRQGDALNAYRAINRQLRDELAIEPGPALRDLHAAILSQSPSLSRDSRRILASTIRELAATFDATLRLPDGSSVPVNAVTRIGRDDTNHVVVDDPAASRHHAVLTETSAGYVLTDQNSTNGTRINQVLIATATVLADGDRITIGRYDIAFHISASPRHLEGSG